MFTLHIYIRSRPRSYDLVLRVPSRWCPLYSIWTQYTIITLSAEGSGECKTSVIEELDLITKVLRWRGSSALSNFAILRKRAFNRKEREELPQSRKDDLAFRRTPLSLLLRPTSQAGSAWRRSRGFHGHLRWPFRRFLQRFPGLAAWLELPLPLLEPTEYLCA